MRQFPIASNITRATLCLLIILSARFAVSENYREWTDSFGRTIEAELIDLKNDEVHLLLSEKYTTGPPDVKAPMKNLSKEDQQWVHQYLKEKEEFKKKQLEVRQPKQKSAVEIQQGRLAQESFRTWTDHKEKTMRGRLVNYVNGFVSIKQDSGKTINVRPNQLR